MLSPRSWRWRWVLGIGLPVALVTVVMTFGECRVNAWHHEPGAAADSAFAFAELAFVQDDIDGAYAQLLPALAAEATVEQIGAAIDSLHPDGRPNSVEAIEYQPTPGYRGMLIFLEGRSGDVVFYYRLQMEGTAPSGYQVAGFWRGNGPYPNPEQRKPIR